MGNLARLDYSSIEVITEGNYMKQKLKRLPFLARLFIMIVIAAISVFLIYLCFEGPFLDYSNRNENQAVYLNNNDYAAVLGVEQFSSDSFLKTYGEPDTVQRWFDPSDACRELVLHSYPKIDVLYYSDANNSGAERLMFLKVFIKDSSIQFGNLNIGVGSQRNKVRFAFLFDPKLSKEETDYEASDFPGVDEGYYGEDWWRILFDYDDSGKVKTMVLSISPN